MTADEIVHRVRASVFAREAEWWIDGDRLAWRETEANARPVAGMIALAKVESVRLTQEPTRGGRRMLCRLRTGDGAAALIGSAHHAGVLRAQDRSDSYRTLVRALIARVAEANPKARFLTGVTPTVWWTVVLGLAALFGAFGAMFVLTGRDVFSTRLLLGLGLVALGAPNLVRWLRSNRPGTFDPADPPLT